MDGFGDLEIELLAAELEAEQGFVPDGLGGDMFIQKAQTAPPDIGQPADLFEYDWQDNFIPEDSTQTLDTSTAEWLADFVGMTDTEDKPQILLSDPPEDEIVVTGTRTDSNSGSFSPGDFVSGIVSLFERAFESMGEAIGTLVSSLTPEQLASLFGIALADDVDIEALTENITNIFDDIADAWNETGIQPTITSGTDGVHSVNSLHYNGNAIDLRTRNLTDSQITSVASALRTSLGGNYDVVVETDHIHVEYDPGG